MGKDIHEDIDFESCSVLI